MSQRLSFNRAIVYYLINMACNNGPCIFLTDKKHTQAKIRKTKNFNFGESLQSVYPLLDIIFGYLDSSDLNNAMLVCKEWHKIAIREKQKRNALSWVICKQEAMRSLQTSNDFYYNNIGKGILIRGKKAPSLDKFVCIHSNDGTVRRMTCMQFMIQGRW